MEDRVNILKENETVREDLQTKINKWLQEEKKKVTGGYEESEENNEDEDDNDEGDNTEEDEEEQETITDTLDTSINTPMQELTLDETLEAGNRIIKA